MDSALGGQHSDRIQRFAQSYAEVLAALCLAWMLALLPVSASAQIANHDGPLCGLGPYDWCAAPAGDPCGEHRDINSCHADGRCVGMRYRGESVARCFPGDRGFSPNCPTVGCRSAGPDQTQSRP